MLIRLQSLGTEPFQRSWGFCACLEDFSICYHEGAISSHIKVTLVELSVSPTSSLRLITAVHFSDMVALDVCDAIQCDKTGERDREVIP